MKIFDKVDIAILTVLLSAIAICLLGIAYSAGAKTEMDRYRKEAIERDFAYYAVNSSGQAVFRWKTPSRLNDGVDQLVRISL